MARDSAEEIRRGREIEHNLGNMAELAGDRFVELVLCHVARDIVEALGEPRPGLFREIGARALLDRFVGLLDEALVAARGP